MPLEADRDGPMNPVEPRSPQHSSGPSSHERPLGSPFGLLHLLLWVSSCATFLGMARRSALGAPLNAISLLLICTLTVFVGACWMGMTLVVARTIGWGRGRVELGAWLLFSLGFIQLANCSINLLPENIAVSKNSLLVAAVCLAWSLPTMSHHLTTGARWLFVALLVIDILWRVPIAMSVLMPGWAWQELESKLRWAVRWPCVVISVALFLTLGRRQSFGNNHGWLHWLGLTCLLVEDLLLIAV